MVNVIDAMPSSSDRTTTDSDFSFDSEDSFVSDPFTDEASVVYILAKELYQDGRPTVERGMDLIAGIRQYLDILEGILNDRHIPDTQPENPL